MHQQPPHQLAGTASTQPADRSPSVPPQVKRRWPLYLVVAVSIAAAAAIAYYMGRREGETRIAEKYHLIPGFAWNQEEWAHRSKGIRTSYNPDHDLNTETLTLVPGDERWLDFVYWCFNNKLAEHQVEAYGGTEWKGPQGGVIFRWAPGSRWDTHTLASFGFTIGHTIGEHRWMDTMFPDFFEKYGGVHGVNVKDRLAELDPTSPKLWVEFLEYCGGSNSCHYRYLFHQEAYVDPVRERICLIGGQGVGFEYSFERFYHEVREVLTDAKAYQFFQMYDLYGPGFAACGGWAKNKLSPSVSNIYLCGDANKSPSRPGVAKPKEQWYNPFPPAPQIPDDIPDLESVRRGQALYKKECAMCHGITGDGKGFLGAGFEVKPRDFRQGWYKFRSTTTGQLPTFEDIERIVRVGVPGTTMPAWGQFFNDQQIRDVSRYLAIFSGGFVNEWRNGDDPERLEISAPPADLAPLAARGAELYKLLGCVNCHGEQGKGDGAQSASLKDNWGFPISPNDLTYKWLFKNGHAPADVYRTLYCGLSGTPMPSNAAAVPKEEDRWALVAFVLSLSPEKRPVLRLKDFKQRSSVIDDRGIVRR